MDNSHQDPGITRGGPPGPAINPTITQEETVMEEMEELVMEALEMGGDSVIKALVFDGHMVLHENLQIVELPAYSILVEYIYESYIEIPTKLLFNSDEQLPNQLAPLDMPGMEEHGENLARVSVRSMN
ncbi:hypothetical protein H4Q26_000947 [Puccinia striiformis f. sp. tritici PST-130]|nr:hypothetical protein H4Q26_000947 [Puccinia striiformis f. sp. tritici PST-130]